VRFVRTLNPIESSPRRVASAALAALVIALLFAASAGAAVRYAAPSGAGAKPCNPTACSLKLAIEGAQDGNEIVVGEGVYSQATAISVTKAVSVGGSPGAPPPTIGMAGQQFEVGNAGANIHDLRITLTKESMARPFVIVSGSAERIVADPQELGGEGCMLTDGILRDSVCIAGLTVQGEMPGTHKAVVANVTADPIFFGASSGEHLEATMVNSIAYPALRPNTSKAGLLIDSAAGGSVSAVVRNSSFNEVDTSLSSGTAFTYTPAGTNGNQTVAPQLVNPAGGDFSPLPSSPTIDAGVAEPVIGATDVLGLPRVQPRCIGGTPIPDIGAYEFQPTEPCFPPPPGAGGEGGGAPVAVGTKKPPSIGKVMLKLHRAAGTGVLIVAVPAAGRVSLSGKGIVAARVVAKKAGTVRLPLAAKGRQATRLARTGKVKLKATVSERLGDGTTLRKSVRVTLKRDSHRAQ
jgi:hypothetical protein